ncbi:hypothetical protein [Naasia sp. SYSU D00057]|uniref:hypothetical protein n=1 Tax=Naasia sp. SYSU D00057 TaxID=2817380 RepID=UPI001B306684|nr:hypothetical protein [Naasia sp. SYSU D00057]
MDAHDPPFDRIDIDEPFDARELADLMERQRFDPETMQPDEEGQRLLSHHTYRWADALRAGVFSLAWPQRLYVPGQVDHRRYWILPPPHENVYQHDWTRSTSPAPTGCYADNGAGTMTASISPTELTGTHRAYTGLAIEYLPTAKLAQVRFSAEVAAMAVRRFDFLTAARYSRFDFFATVLLRGWEINPVTGTWELLAPFANSPVIAQTHYGQQAGLPYTVPVSLPSGTLGVNFLVEKGKRYAFGVLFRVTIVADARGADERSVYRPRADDRIALQSLLSGAVPEMTVDTTAVYQT